ncbi:methyl-accepting chemotaxis protein [bacterium]|nr:methyl-accepting chemotaxis protein [bacterium]
MLSKMKIGTKIGGGFAVVLLLTVIVAIASFTSIRTMNAKTSEATGLRVDELKLAYEMAWSMSKHVMAARGYLLYGNQAIMGTYEKESATFKSNAQKLEGMITSAEGKELIRKAKEGEAAYDRVLKDQCLPAYRAGNHAKVSELAQGPLANAGNETITACDEMLSLIQKLMDNAAGQANKAGTNAIKIVCTLSFLAVIFGVFIAFTVTKAIVKPVTGLVKDAEQVAEGDLTVNVALCGEDEVGKLSQAFRRMVESLKDTIIQVTNSSEKVTVSSQSLSATSEEINKATQQITETITQVATGSQEQSKNAQSSATSMEQLGRAVQEVATGAQTQANTVDQTVALVQQISTAIDHVSSLSQEAAASGQQVTEVANTGGRHVADTVGGMDRIKEATDKVGDMVKRLGENSQQIGAIVETIDDIAEQTNLLALNAAIEAARAGEHGKGFAVVADEVRKLAERSSKATGEIAELISNIQQMTEQAVVAMNQSSQEVAEGTQLANQAGEALSGIQEAVVGIVRQIEQVSAATQQMASSSTEVVRAIENVSSVTEETTAAAEQMSASSDDVARQIEQVAAVSEENAAAAEEVSATTEEQMASVEELTASAEELAQMAEELQGLVAQFKVDDAPVRGTLQDVSRAVTSERRKKAA